MNVRNCRYYGSTAVYIFLRMQLLRQTGIGVKSQTILFVLVIRGKKLMRDVKALAAEKSGGAMRRHHKIHELQQEIKYTHMLTFSRLPVCVVTQKACEIEERSVREIY